ncbi:hypothetical protein [Metabacillus bambusae]|uniref:Uncharacterized protein n=1 Tax=Metabacillus bambusae TaxID=2795218 RepID=A0ABS3NB68_9BACI|nr:hypothetical protein [Metabacillus bambusae]MBO1515478.1 hypothetical protein [Metabacillus bambusae]
MLVKMKRKDFDLLTSADLSKGCFEPLINIYKSRITEKTTFSNSQIQEHFYEQLTEGQRALFMFYAYYIHVSKSINEFYWWSAYFMAQPKSWSALKVGINYFQDESMLLLLEKVELELKRHNHPVTIEGFTVRREELELNKELYASIKSLHDMFYKTSSLTISNINKYIENNHLEFVEIDY